MAWVKYRHLRGTLSTPRRIEQALARSCHVVAVAAGLKPSSDNPEAKYTQLHFMPHEDGYAEINTEITFDDFFKREVSNGKT